MRKQDLSRKCSAWNAFDFKLNFWGKKKSQIQFRNYENPGGGLNSSKMSEFQILTLIDDEK